VKYQSPKREERKESSTESFSLGLSRVDFHSKISKASHAINHPMEKPMDSPMGDKMRMINQYIDKELSHKVELSPLSERRAEAFAYNTQAHKPRDLLQCLFRSLHDEREKLSFTVLKLIDMLIERNVPKVLHHLLFAGVERSVAKLVRGTAVSGMSASDLLQRYFKLFPQAEKHIHELPLSVTPNTLTQAERVQAQYKEFIYTLQGSLMTAHD